MEAPEKLYLDTTENPDNVWLRAFRPPFNTCGIEYIRTYESEDGRIGFCDHTRKCKNGGFGKSYRHWRIEDKVYKNKDKFIEALADFNPKVINIKDKPYKNTIARMKNDVTTTTSSITDKTPPRKR